MKQMQCPISAPALESFLTKCTFRRQVQGSEVVYVRENDMCQAVRVKVWTTIDAKTGTIRQKGRDAIRISAAYEGRIPLDRPKSQKPSTNFGIYKTPRVNRTGEEGRILDRVYNHMREAYSFTNEWIRNHWRELGDQCHEVPPAVATPAVSTPPAAGPAVSTPAVSTPPTAEPLTAGPAVSSPMVSGPAVGVLPTIGPLTKDLLTAVLLITGLEEDDYE
jgi:hypothetical protein